jgi:hypothetical protein
VFNFLLNLNYLLQYFIQQSQGAGVMDSAEKALFDLYLAKYWGIRFATAAACTVLKVDQVSFYTVLHVEIPSSLAFKKCYCV